jgi:hypothetical protein
MDRRASSLAGFYSAIRRAAWMAQPSPARADDTEFNVASCRRLYQLQQRCVLPFGARYLLQFRKRHEYEDYRGRDRGSFFHLGFCR